MERSKRESKYMGVPKEARELLQWESGPPPQNVTWAGCPASHGPEQYPQEKGKFVDESTAPGSHSFGSAFASSPVASEPPKLDVSRLMTLPPPYPRHHPAVNNSHPELASIRANLRSLLDLEDAKSAEAKFSGEADRRQNRKQSALREKRGQLRYNLQENLRSGIMTHADAELARADFEARERKHHQDMVQEEFDVFQRDVASPLHALLCERITKASASMDVLASRLLHNALERDPNQTQEEGDEQPELLEMLTLFKWLFETREQLHKELFELENERSNLYKPIIATPYLQVGNGEKAAEVDTFFRRDAQDRGLAFQSEAVQRHEDVLHIVEQHVTRGVETQLSAFWDIAPGLLAIVQDVPERLHDFDVAIPMQEFEESPSYHEHPLQYLYTLLAHASRSAHQFVESQINLLCLLHEVKSGSVAAGFRQLEMQRQTAGEHHERVESETAAMREYELGRLTEDLQEKVRLVDGQWDEAFGRAVEACKARVEVFLRRQGGWDDGLQE